MKRILGYKNKVSNLIRITTSLGVVIMIVTSLSGCYLFPKVEKVSAPELLEPQRLAYTTVPVKKGAIEKKFILATYLLPVNKVDAGFKYNGLTLDNIYVRPGDMVSAGDLIATADTSKTQTNIKNKEIEIRKAQIDYSKLKISGASQFQLESAELDMDLLNLQLENYKKDLEKTNLYAPISGKVEYIDNNIKAGDNISVNKTIVSIADMSSLKLVYPLNSALDKDRTLKDFARVGMKVNVRIGLNQYEGEIVMTPYEAEKVKDISTKEILWIDIKNLDQQIDLGTCAQVDVVMDKKEDVLVVSKDLVQKFGTIYYVRVLEDGAKCEKTVVLGLENETEVEIQKGLEVGEQLIVK